MTRDQTTFAFLAAITAIALFFCYLLVAPFLKPIVFAAILAIIFYPVQGWTHGWIRNRNAAAALSTTAVIVFIALATIFLGRAILSGLGDIYQSLANPGEGKERLSAYVLHVLERAVGIAGRYIPISVTDLRTAISSQAEKVISTLLAMSAGALGSITSLVGNALISFFILFFLFAMADPCCAVQPSCFR